MPNWNLKSNWPGILIFSIALGVFCWAAGLGWNSPPTDSHAGRQTQTAITAQMLYENGRSPLTPFNGLGPPWNIPMEFPTYQIATATLANFTGGNIITAGRLAAVLGALLVLPPLWLLLGRLQLSGNERLFICTLLFSSPLWLHFSRSILIETWAASLALWWLAALVESLHQPNNRRWLIAAVTLGILAALTKVTSFAVVLPVGALLMCLLRTGTFRQRLSLSTFATLPGILAAVFWTRQTDAIKHAHPFADFLTSEKLSAWNWGTLAQRLSAEWWQRWTEHLTQILYVGLYALVVIGLVKGTSKIRFGIGAGLLAAITGPLAFANLYCVHNYYFIAVAPALAVAVGLGAVPLCRMLMPKRWGKLLITVGLTGIIYLQAQAFLNGFGHGQTLDRPLPEFGKLIREISTPQDNIAIIGREWDPLLTYTTNRKMLFVRETHETDEDAWQLSRSALGDDDYSVLVAMDSVAGDLALVHHRCEELGLATTPLFTTGEADVYVSPQRLAELAPWVAQQHANATILPERPFRMGPGESRLEFITADWRKLTFSEAQGMFDQCQPYPAMVFTRHAPAQLEANGASVLHIHPPGGLRFDALATDRTVALDYGLRPEIWQNNHDSDGVRFRLFIRGPGGRQRLAWTDWVQPLTVPEDQTMLHAEIPLPADHELELWIDAGPDHNPGYDWSIIGQMTVK